MLRVGLTGGLGSGKSTAAGMFAAHGAHVLSSDEIGRTLMMHRDSGLRNAIVARFGPEVLRADGTLDRAVLARMAFADGRVEELNGIVHPAVLARQEDLIREIAARDSSAIIIVESALIFETKHGGENGWRSRFDRVVLVTAPESMRIERYIQRMSEIIAARRASREAHHREARKRMSYQIPEEHKIAWSDYLLVNDGTVEKLQAQVDELWEVLRADERARGEGAVFC